MLFVAKSETQWLANVKEQPFSTNFGAFNSCFTYATIFGLTQNTIPTINIGVRFSPIALFVLGD